MSRPSGLAPIATREARVLILGSFPGERSLALGRYYAHGQNRFWRVMAPILGVAPDAAYAARRAALRARGIALWDVLASCERAGSLDADIVRASEVPNPLAEFITRRPRLGGICFNGRTAAALFARHVLPEAYWQDSGLLMRTLPSTSPAHAAMRLEDLTAHWREALESIGVLSPAAAGHPATAGR